MPLHNALAMPCKQNFTDFSKYFAGILLNECNDDKYFFCKSHLYLTLKLLVSCLPSFVAISRETAVELSGVWPPARDIPVADIDAVRVCCCLCDDGGGGEGVDLSRGQLSAPVGPRMTAPRFRARPRAVRPRLLQKIPC